MTKKLYHNDSYKLEFTAEICKREIYENKYSVVFSQTYFYPTSGGQLHDIGFINGIKVLDVVQVDDDILHITEKEITEDNVECNINKERRFDFMQQHTGQHILSESIAKVFGYETASCHLGEEMCTIDINASSLSTTDIQKIELFANNIVCQNLPVKVHYVQDTEINKLPLRKAPKFTGLLRIIEIDKFDFSACGGTHVKTTGEVGIIKIRKRESVKGNLTRIEFLCGTRALLDYQTKSEILNSLANSFTTTEKEVIDKVKKIVENNKQLVKELDLYKTELLKFEIVKLAEEAIIDKQYKIIKKTFKDRDINEIRILAQKIIEYDDYIILFGSVSNSSNIIFARSKNVPVNMQQLFNSISEMIGAKGGGKPDLVQAGLKNQNRLEEALTFAMRLIDA
jgi:alanyl-tRNA synthetase